MVIRVVIPDIAETDLTTPSLMRSWRPMPGHIFPNLAALFFIHTSNYNPKPSNPKPNYFFHIFSKMSTCDHLFTFLFIEVFMSHVIADPNQTADFLAACMADLVLILDICLFAVLYVVLFTLWFFFTLIKATIIGACTGKIHKAFFKGIKYRAQDLIHILHDNTGPLRRIPRSYNLAGMVPSTHTYRTKPAYLTQIITKVKGLFITPPPARPIPRRTKRFNIGDYPLLIITSVAAAQGHGRKASVDSACTEESSFLSTPEDERSVDAVDRVWLEAMHKVTITEALA